MRSWVGVPLVVGNEVVGVLSVQSFSPHVYTEDHVELLRAAAAPVAVAVRNARAFSDLARLERKLRAVEEAARRMQLAPDPETLYRTVLDLTRNTFDYAPCAILVPQGKELVVVAEHGELAWARGTRLPSMGRGSPWPRSAPGNPCTCPTSARTPGMFDPTPRRRASSPSPWSWETRSSGCWTSTHPAWTGYPLTIGTSWGSWPRSWRWPWRASLGSGASRI